MEVKLTLCVRCFSMLLVFPSLLEIITLQSLQQPELFSFLLVKSSHALSLFFLSAITPLCGNTRHVYEVVLQSKCTLPAPAGIDKGIDKLRGIEI